MNNELLIKRFHDEAMLPSKGHAGDAAFDLRFCGGYGIPTILSPREQVKIRTGFGVHIPKGYVGLIKDRSGLAGKHGLSVRGGVIDSNYVGELFIVIRNSSDQTFTINHGDRIAQLLIVPSLTSDYTNVKEVLTLPHEIDTERGEDALGSTGVQ